MHLTFTRFAGTFLVLAAIVVVTAGLAAVAARLNTPPVVTKPVGLSALEAAENRDFEHLLNDIRPSFAPYEMETVPPIDPDAPVPSGTYLYNNLLDNLLSALHYYYRVPEDADPSTYVTSWDPDTGERVLSTGVRLPALEMDISYLLALEMYRTIHRKAVFDEDLENARQRVAAIFAEDWHTVKEWPLGPYFDLITLYELTEEEQYLQWAERYGAGDGSDDPNTPLAKARSLLFRYQHQLARQASPFYFHHAALLSDWGNRHDPALASQARTLFEGLRDMMYDARYKMLWKQVSVPQDGSSIRNIIQTFDTIEQLSAVRAILEYWRTSNDPEAVSLARAIMQGVWDEGSPLLIQPPEEYPPSTYFGLYTAYDVEREAERLTPTEKTIVQILLFETVVLLNEHTRGEFRGDVDFLASWLEDNGPLYRIHANGYYGTYDDDWADPEQPMVSAKASIWMSRAIARDEWYRFQRAQALTSTRPES